MEALFTHDYFLLWMAVLAAALFLPVRRLIFVIYVRRAEQKEPTDEAARERLKRRAGFTAALVCFVFSYIYVQTLFG